MEQEQKILMLKVDQNLLNMILAGLGKLSIEQGLGALQEVQKQVMAFNEEQAKDAEAKHKK